jgi:predicted thioesterase
MYEKIVVGLTGELSAKVTMDRTASHLGSGNVAVLATPEMIRLMEGSAVAAVDHLLPDGSHTVGIRVDVRHLAATPVDFTVRARAELLEVDGRRLRFRVEAFDEAEKIGEGGHERMIIDVEKFRKRVEGKRAAKGD